MLSVSSLRKHLNSTNIAVQRAEEQKIAFAEGIEQGIFQGAYQKARETAAAFKKLGIDIVKIAKAYTTHSGP